MGWKNDFRVSLVKKGSTPYCNPQVTNPRLLLCLSSRVENSSQGSGKFKSIGVNMMDWTNKVVLVTGGTGSFGKKFIEVMLKRVQTGQADCFQPG
jgi:hypothetical protein